MSRNKIYDVIIISKTEVYPCTSTIRIFSLTIFWIMCKKFSAVKMMTTIDEQLMELFSATKVWYPPHVMKRIFFSYLISELIWYIHIYFLKTEMASHHCIVGNTEYCFKIKFFVLLKVSLIEEVSFIKWFEDLDSPSASFTAASSVPVTHTEQRKGRGGRGSRAFL